MLASEEDPNADHDDEDGDTKIETTVKDNLDIHSHGHLNSLTRLEGCIQLTAFCSSNSPGITTL